MKGKIIEIKTMFGDFNDILGYFIIIETDEIPNLKLGKCEVKQWKENIK